MPIPVPSTEAPAPRRLLRDVVFDKMLAAIGDGTLELGERLNDDELVRWLGVSRTPVREAIAKLADYGLVDIEANRYTRIISPTVADFADTLTTAHEVWGIVVRRGIPALTPATAKQVSALVSGAGRDAAGKVRGDTVPNFSQAMSLLATVSESPSVQRLLATVGDRAALLLGLAAKDVVLPSAATVLPGLLPAIEKRDGNAAAALFADALAGLPAYYDEVAAAGVFPTAPAFR